MALSSGKSNLQVLLYTIVIFLFVTNHNLQLCILQLHYKRLPYNECWVLCVFIHFFYLAFSCILYLVGIFHVWKGVGSRMKPSKTPALTGHSSEDFASWITRSRLLLRNDYVSLKLELDLSLQRGVARQILSKKWIYHVLQLELLGSIKSSNNSIS